MPPFHATLERLDEVAKIGEWDLFALLDRYSRNDVLSMGAFITPMSIAMA